MLGSMSGAGTSAPRLPTGWHEPCPRVFSKRSPHARLPDIEPAFEELVDHPLVDWLAALAHMPFLGELLGERGYAGVAMALCPIHDDFGHAKKPAVSYGIAPGSAHGA